MRCLGSLDYSQVMLGSGLVTNKDDAVANQSFPCSEKLLVSDFTLGDAVATAQDSFKSKLARSDKDITRQCLLQY
uniref:Uncharacterized protein n=2 Tax=Amphimedon queenslandica TaxID=400682 RepID=A0A1X7VQH5_AMPQE